MNWFAQLFGFEEDGADVQRRLLLEEVDGSWRLRSTVNNASFGVGHFSTPSLAEMMERAESATSSGACSSTLSMVAVISDVSVLHALPENRHSTFQVASQ